MGPGPAPRPPDGGGATGQRSLAQLPDLTPFRTPYKYGARVLEKSGIPGSFDERSVDCPFVFSANGRFYMTYVGFDGTGYQTGLAQSDDLVRWQRAGSHHGARLRPTRSRATTSPSCASCATTRWIRMRL